MAYLKDDEQDNGQGINGTNAQGQTAPLNTSGPSASAFAGGDSAAPTAANKPKSGASSGMGGQFANYLKANQGKAQEKLGQSVQSNLNQSGTAAQNSITGAQNQFGQKLEAGTLANRGQALSDVGKAVQQARNVYTGNIANDTAAAQQKLAGVAGDIASTQKYKEDEAARITNERASIQQQQDAYAKQLRDERNAAVQTAQQAAAENPFGSDSYGSFKGQQEQQALRQAQDAYNNANNDAAAKFADQNTALEKAEKLLPVQDTRLQGLMGQQAATQKQLEMLANPNLVQSVDPETQQRFADIINARYSGPASIRQAGLYEPAYQNVQTAQDKFNLAKTAGGRQDLLSQMYGVNGQQYGRGLSGLDSAILNTNTNAVQGLQNTANQFGDLQGKLDTAQIGSETAATNRGNEIAGIRNQGRNAFTTGQNEELTGTEANIDTRVKQGQDFINQLKSAFQPENTGTQNLSSAEAAILGIQNGEGLYNLGENTVQQKALERERLVTGNEQARLLALSQLAGLDKDSILNKDNKYADATKAGTQTATDALDRDAVRQAVANSEQNFRDTAAGTTISGTGSGKGSSGGAFGSKSSKATRTLSANLKDALQNSGGYDFNSEINRNTLGNNNILSNITNALNYASPDNPTSTPGAINPDGSFSDVSQPGLNAGNLGFMADGSLADPEFLKSLGAEIPGLAPLGDIGANVINSIPGIGDLAGTFSSALGGSSGEAKAKAEKKALAAAKDELKRNFENTLQSQGYNNRVAVNDQTPETAQRTAALEALLRQFGGY